MSFTPSPALNWLHTARFWLSAPTLNVLPASQLPEIAFVGRSNAGKSTCINTLTQQRQLAFASKTPGRTQDINLFMLGRGQVHEATLADLPGYGYAAVPQAAKHRWQAVMGQYLQERPNLAGVVMMCDSRLGLTPLDEDLLDLIADRVEAGMPFLVLLTKSDKLNKTAAEKALSIARLQTNGGQANLFSALKKRGVEEAAQIVWNWCHPQKEETAVIPEEGTSL